MRLDRISFNRNRGGDGGPPRPPGPAPAHQRPADPRWFQIGALSLLLAYGVFALGFPVGPTHLSTLFAAALATQWIGGRLSGQARFDPLSAIISALGLATLLRTPSLAMTAATAALAIASKFAIRWNGKHVFNPTNFALVVMLAAGAPVWISPGQYGHVAFVALGIGCAGSVVVNRAARSDVTFAFLAAWAAVLCGRSWWLGEPMSIPLHRLEGGLLLQFAFFMISDPRTTPRSRAGRLIFAVLVASGAAFVQFVLFRTNGLLWSLAVCTLAVPLLDRLLPGPRYEWSHASSRPGHPKKGTVHETSPDPGRRAGDRLVPRPVL